MAPVHGKVTVKGKPLEQGVVMFYPESGRPATGQIADDGSYNLTTLSPGDGAIPGEYTVTVEAVETTGGAPPPQSLEQEIAGGATIASEGTTRWLVPQEYADRTTTPLTATVGDGDNEINFEIP